MTHEVLSKRRKLLNELRQAEHACRKESELLVHLSRESEAAALRRKQAKNRVAAVQAELKKLNESDPSWSW